MKVLTKVYAYKDKRYVIAKNNDGIIMAIDYKYINEDGVLTQELNGLQMFVDVDRNTVPEIIERINRYTDWCEYTKEHNVDLSNTKSAVDAYMKFCDERERTKI